MNPNKLIRVTDLIVKHGWAEFLTGRVLVPPHVVHLDRDPPHRVCSGLGKLSAGLFGGLCLSLLDTAGYYLQLLDHMANGKYLRFRFKRR